MTYTKTVFFMSQEIYYFGDKITVKDEGIQTKTIGFIVNPIAGMGGAVA